ncbi:N-acetyltransferase [Actinoplanes philippinensis]|uniref:Ornithine decarboxylase n=1 Tax=Actinoplanes philippinensis TaxID=35752 RepID=A0A1I2HK89_9ACTN|nr:GNAT family N-acetyltransferase [Actinoplanes philippinensis]GIE82972.1 N-acetyltransferase [Actinoplanes philippinensis]SFF29700.1 ornithine decarboxylase [Actinoplanes philippinensis]
MPDRERLRPIEETDWPAILTLEAETYGDKGLAEGGDALRSRAHPPTSFVLDTGGRLGGYLLALPYPRGAFPDLRRPEDRAFDTPDLHLHDIAIAPGLRDHGRGRRLVRHLVTLARLRAYERISLVSVGNAAGFWTACGFRPDPRCAPPGSYGPGAVYMSRDIG